MKAYTDFEQSKKLAEILPIESADMGYIPSEEDDDGNTLYTAEFKSEFIFDDDCCIQCWSLAALLNYLREIDFFPSIEADEHGVTMSVCYYDEEEGKLLNPVHDITTEADNFVDACYEMIIRLNKE